MVTGIMRGIDTPKELKDWAQSNAKNWEAVPDKPKKFLRNAYVAHMEKLKNVVSK